jgi:DnaJ like chaperone protein
MKYRNYGNGNNFFLLGLMFFIFFGGFKLIFVLVPLVFALFFNFLPLILLFFVARQIFGRISKNSKINQFVQHDTVEHKRFVELLIHILVHAMKADGKVDEREKQVIFGFFRANLKYKQAQLLWVQDLVSGAIKKSYPLAELCAEFSQRFNYASRLILLELVYHVVMSDDQLTGSEAKIVEQVVGQLGINNIDHERIKAAFPNQSNHDHHYQLLGIGKEATKADLKKAYKEACKKYHPDKVFHLGEEFRKIADEKMTKINASYAILSKQLA